MKSKFTMPRQHIPLTNSDQFRECECCSRNSGRDDEKFCFWESDGQVDICHRLTIKDLIYAPLQTLRLIAPEKMEINCNRNTILRHILCSYFPFVSRIIQCIFAVSPEDLLVHVLKYNLNYDEDINLCYK